MSSDCWYKLLWAVIAYRNYYVQWLLIEIIISSDCLYKLLWAVIAYNVQWLLIEIIMSIDSFYKLLWAMIAFINYYEQWLLI